VKHAYLILAHQQPEMLKPLLSMLDDPRNDLYLHIDPCAGRFTESDFAGMVLSSNLSLVKSKRIIWADYSMVQAEMRLFKAAANAKNAPYAYYHLLSGQDLPLKPQYEIHQYFSDHQGNEFVHFTTLEAGEKKEGRMRYWWPLQQWIGRKSNQFAKIQTRFIDYQQRRGWDRFKGTGIELRTGAQWVSLSHDFVQYLLAHKKWIRDHCRLSFCPDESFIQTLIYNSPFRMKLYRPLFDDGYASIVRRIDWKRGGPYVWRMDDYEELTTCPEMFARKFDPDVDQVIISAIAEFVRG